jgi:hypothetical protein
MLLSDTTFLSCSCTYSGSSAYGGGAIEFAGPELLQRGAVFVPAVLNMVQQSFYVVVRRLIPSRIRLFVSAQV